MFEWDEAKRAENLASQGIDFVRAARMFDNAVLEREDARQFHGEKRYIAIGHADGQFLVAVWTPRGKYKRLLAAWRADQDDEAFYRAALNAPAREDARSQSGGRALPGKPRGAILEIGDARLALPKPKARKTETRS
jgi:uncharacterized DUF497 family protein